MKKTKGLIILPLVALLLCSCRNVEQPTSSEESSEQSSIEESEQEVPSESDESSESSSLEPSEPDESSESSSSEKKSVTTYKLVINNKEELTTITSSEDSPNTNVYTLDIDLYTYIDGVEDSSIKAEASDVTITSSNDNAIAVSGLTLILGSQSDANVTLSAAWNEHDARDSVNINYTYTAHVEVVSYRYELTITNKEALTATWKIDDSGSRSVAVSLAKYTIVDGIEQQNPEIDTTGTDVTLTQDGEGEVVITGLDIAPSKVGSLVLTATYQNGEASATDSVQLAIEDSIYEYNYDLTIDNKEEIQTTEQDPWVYQTGSKTVSITLSYYTYTASSGESVESTLEGTTQNVSISVYNASGEAADSDITYSNAQGGISLSLSAVNSTYYTVVFTWTSHTQASDSLTFYVSEPLEGTTTYSISIDNREALTASWYLGDNDRTLEYSVKATTGEDTVDVALEDYIDGISVSTSPEGYVNATLDTTSGAITLSLVNVPEDDTTVTIYLKWEQYGITEYVELNLGVHTYKIEITNTEELMASWSIEDQITREVKTECYIDSELQSTLGIGHVVISSSDETKASVDGNTISAVGEGTPTVTATWYKDDENQDILASDSVLLSINDNVKATAIKINTLDSNTLSYMEEVEISASVTGKDGRAATDPEVSWQSSNPTGISVAVDPIDSTKATVTGLVYSAEATITATCGELSDSIELAVAEYVFTGTKAKAVNHSPLPTVVDTPNDRGVYVLGTQNGGTYLAYDGSFKTTASYDEAAAVRTIASNDGYLLSIDGKYLTEQFSLDDSKENAKEFSISSNGVSSLYEDSGSLATSGTQLYIIDIVRDENESYVYQGSYYLRSTHTATEYFNGNHTGTSNIRLNTTTDISQAVKVTIEYADHYSEDVVDEESGQTSTVHYDNAYYMSFGDGTNKTYIGVNAGDIYVSLSSSPIPIFYNSTNDTWCDATTTRYLGGNSVSNEEIIGSYQYTTAGNINSGQPPVTLYDEQDMPSIKGIGVVAEEYSFDESLSTDLTLTTYPSCIGIPLEFSDLTMTQSGDGSVSFSAPHLTGESAGNVDVTFTYKDGISDTISFVINQNESGKKALTFDYTFVSGDLGATGSSSTSSGTSTFGGLTWSYSETNYKTFSSSDYIHLGSGSNNCTETDGAFSFWTDFGEEVTLTSASLEMKTAASTSAGYKIELGNIINEGETDLTYTEVARETISANTSFAPYSATLNEEGLDGQSIKFTVWAGSTKKAVYIKSVTFTILVDANSTLSF